MQKLLTFTLFCCALATITSCSKSLDKSPVTTALNTPGNGKAARLSTTAGDLTGVITGKTWVYYEYFTDFTNTTTNLVWKTNRTSNTLNLSLNKVKYYTDGTYTEVTENGTTLNGTWTFLNNQTQVSVTNPVGTFVSTIQDLTSNRYEWLQSSGRYGVMIPVDTTGGSGNPIGDSLVRRQLLTAQPWVYSEYFNNFNLTTPALVWKPNKANSPLNLSQNVVKYNNDGSYWEIDQNGNTFTGTWTFLSNMTQVQVSNNTGLYTSTIKVLNNDRYEWLSSNGVAYGEMVHQ
jgi:hypothetical protein